MKAKSSYFDKVYWVTQQIPRGRVSTYGAIADYLALGSARMVGWALNKCGSLSGISIPAHRVVNRKGELSGRRNFENPFIMEALLVQEGVEIEDNKVVSFESLFWHPGDHLELEL